MKLATHKSLMFSLLFFMALLANSNLVEATSCNQKQNHKVDKFKIVFLITEDPDNYEAHKTVPVFAETLKKKYGYDVSVLLGRGEHGFYQYPNMDNISTADLLIVFARRIALPHEQMNALKRYLSSGKPLMGIRTANHAFTARDKIEEGYEDWPRFVSDILGCENRGYGPVETGTDVSVAVEAINHPILKNIKPKQWHSQGNVYLVAPLLDKDATILLTGKANNISQPIAWTRTVGKSRVFYTSLGFPTDFKTPQFTTLLVNAIKWTLLKEEVLPTK